MGIRESDSSGDAEVDEIAREIMGYLSDRPLAKDTEANIKRWWIAARRIERGLQKTSSALAYLECRGLISKEVVGQETVFGLPAGPAKPH